MTDTVLPELREGPSLARLLTMMDEIDNQLLNLPQEEMALVGAVSREKVDGICKYFDAVWERVEQLKAMKLQIAAMQKALTTKYESFERFLTKEMTSRGIEKLPGNVFQLSVTTREKVVTDNIEFTDAFVAKYRPYIRSYHEFKKTEIKEDLNSGHFDLPFAHVIDNPSISFSLKRKEIEK